MICWKLIYCGFSIWLGQCGGLFASSSESTLVQTGHGAFASSSESTLVQTGHGAFASVLSEAHTKFVAHIRDSTSTFR